MGTTRKLLKRMRLVSGKIWMELAHFCKNDTNKPHTCKCMTVQGELFGRQNAQLSPTPGARGGVEEVRVKGKEIACLSVHVRCLACFKEHVLLP